MQKKLHVSMEFTDREIRLLWYGPGKLNSAVFEVFPLPTGVIEKGNVRQPLELTRALEMLIKRQSPKGKIVAKVAIHMQNGFIREYTLPWVPQRERKKLIDYLADEEIPIPPSERIYDCWVKEEKKDKLRLVLIAMHKALLLSYLTSLEAVGFLVKVIGFSSVAWAQALALDNGEYNLLIKSKEQGETDFVFYHGITPAFNRTLRFSAESLSLEERADEVKRIMMNFFNTHENMQLQKIIICEGEKNEECGRLVQSFLSNDENSVTMLTIAQMMSIGRIPTPTRVDLDTDKIDIGMLAVLGLALVKNPNQPNNLLREKRRMHSEMRKRWLVAFLFLSLSLAGFELKDELTKAVEALEDDAVRLQTIHEKESNRAVYQKKGFDEWQYLLNHPTDSGRELTSIQNLTGGGLRFQRLEYKENSIYIQGSASHSGLVQELLLQMLNLGWKNPHLVNYHQAEHGEARSSIEFALMATFK